MLSLHAVVAAVPGGSARSAAASPTVNAQADASTHDCLCTAPGTVFKAANIPRGWADCGTVFDVDNICAKSEEAQEYARKACCEGGEQQQPRPTNASSVIACIVEPRAEQRAAIEHVVQNIADVLGPSVPIQFYHGNTTDVCIPWGESSTCRLHREGRLQLIPLGVDNFETSDGGYSRLLTTKRFWEAKRGWDKTLIFQTDSVLCNATDERIENFMGLDYVGGRAYDGWTGVAIGGNGGLSLRDTRLSLECSSEDGQLSPEDAYFIKCIQARGGRLATKAEQERFATQNYFAAKSLGAHQINAEMRWTDADNLAAFREYCPEYLETMKLVSREKAERQGRFLLSVAAGHRAQPPKDAAWAAAHPKRGHEAAEWAKAHPKLAKEPEHALIPEKDSRPHPPKDAAWAMAHPKRLNEAEDWAKAHPKLATPSVATPTRARAAAPTLAPTAATTALTALKDPDDPAPASTATAAATALKDPNDPAYDSPPTAATMAMKDPNDPTYRSTPTARGD